MGIRLDDDDNVWVWNTLARMREKYEKIGYDYNALSKYIVYLEPELPVPYEEAYNDLLEWSKALKALNDISVRLQLDF